MSFSKKLILVISLSLCAIGFSQNETKATAGVFEFQSEIIDYGTLTQHADGMRKFKFKNVGNAPIVITKVKGSCGCTVAEKPKDPILPNKTGVITVKYDTKRLGKFSKSVAVSSNASEALKTLKIKGNVIAEDVASLKN